MKENKAALIKYNIDEFNVIYNKAKKVILYFIDSFSNKHDIKL